MEEITWSDDPEWIYGFGEMEEPEDDEPAQVCERCSRYETCDIISDGDCPFYDPSDGDEWNGTGEEPLS